MNAPRQAGTTAHTAVTLNEARWRGLQQQMLDDPCQAVARGVRASSRGRPWRGLAVWRQSGPVEDLYIAPTRMHCLVIRWGPATARLQQRQGNHTDERDWQPGQAIVVPTGTPSFWRSSAERDNLHINLCPSWLARAAGNDGGTPPTLHSGFGVDDPMLRCFGHLLLHSLDSNVSLHPAFADGQAIGLAVHLLEHHVQEGAARRRTGALTRRQLGAVMDAVQADPAADWSVLRLAALLQISPFHFARAFKAACGETPHCCLMRLRLERARHLVLATSQPLTAVAVDTGFASLSHFSQAFRRHWGTSPSQLRRES